MEIIIVYLVIINVITFFLYGSDKHRAKQDRWRIPERVLIMVAIVGGTIGAMAGMKVFHHKTRKPKFALGVPVIFLLQVAAVSYILFFAK